MLKQALKQRREQCWHSVRSIYDRRQDKDQMHEVLAGIPRASAETPKWVPDELSALQSADHVRLHFRRQKHPPGAHERERSASSARRQSGKRTTSGKLTQQLEPDLAVDREVAPSRSSAEVPGLASCGAPTMLSCFR